MGPKKKSGSAFKKSRAARDESAKKLATNMGKWLKQQTSGETSTLGPSSLPKISESFRQEKEESSGEETEEKEVNEKCSDITMVEIGRLESTTSQNLDAPKQFNVNDGMEKGIQKLTDQDQQNVQSDEDKDEHVTDDDEGSSSNIDVDADIQDLTALNTYTERNVGLLELIYNDPCKWPTVTDSVRVKLVEKGPQTVDLETFNFPHSDDGRHLNKKWFFKDLFNGEFVKRRWMLYSESKDAVFCFPCLLFSKNPKSSIFSDIAQGFNDWKYLNPYIKNHEQSEMHDKKSYVEWKELELRLRKSSTLDADIQRVMDAETEKWRNIVIVIVDVVLYCAKNNLPLRGSSDSISDHNCGVFLSTLELISHYHPQLKQHIEDIRSKKGATSYFSPQIQNEVIEILGKKVRSHILEQVKSAKYYSIMFDCTPDVSHSEQMSQVIRYVECSTTGCKIVESLVDFIVSHKKTGAGLSEEILSKLKEDGLNISDCRGQGFDNGSNMAGVYNGVQAHISRWNDLARFVPCAAHSLNLVGVHAAQSSPMMISFFGVVQNMFCFFSGSTIRWEFVHQYLDTTLKAHTETRWSSKRQAITSVEKNLKHLFTALQQMTNTEEWNNDTAHGAFTILKNINFKFVCLLHVWSEILVSVDCTNKLLQKKNISLDIASKLMKGLASKIQERRNNGIDDILEKAATTCLTIGIESEFSTTKRMKIVKKMASENARDEGHLLSPKQAFQRECFCVFDKLIMEMENRAQAYELVNTDFEFLSGASLHKLTKLELENCAKDFALKYDRDVDAFEMVREVSNFKGHMSHLNKDLNKLSHFDLLDAICVFDLRDAYPNIEIALRIYLTMPVSVASCERSFSKLKLIKNYLRSRIGQGRLSSLAILSIEYQTTEILNFDEVIKEFASLKVRKVKFS